MISREADYGIRTVLHLSKEENKNRLISTAELAEQMLIPYALSRKVVRRLCDGGIVESRRGKQGGIMLARPKKEISLLDVLNVMDQKAVTLNSCLIESCCKRSGCCGVHQELFDLQTMIDERLGALTFDQLD